MPLLPISKLQKLIPLLGSDQDGEVVAAARMIGRALKAADCDMHDLVKGLSNGRPQVVEKIVYRDRTVEKPVYRTREEPMRPGQAGWRPSEAKPGVGSERDEVLMNAPALLASGKLNARSEEFVEQQLMMARRFANFSMSEKQLKWFRDLVAGEFR